MEEPRTLVVSKSYEPIKVVTWERAVTLLFQGKVEVLQSHEAVLRSTSTVIQIPAIARLLQPFKRQVKQVKFSRASVYGRDGHRCQYCHQKKDAGDLTYDHVVPRRNGGQTVWTNIVTCCYACNERKGGRTPEQAKMPLKHYPTQPQAVPRLIDPEAWKMWEAWGHFGSPDAN